jgi:hypothetical protein
MRKVIIALVLAVVLSLALAAPVFADQDGEPNANAWWGQAVSDNTPRGEHASSAAGTPRMWGRGGIRGAHE